MVKLMNSIDNDKKSCRERILSLRDAQSSDEILKNSRVIFNSLISTKEYQKNTKIMFFMGKEKEVQTEFMVEEALKNGKRIFVPITNTEERKLIPCEIKSLEELVLSTFNVKEPKADCQRIVNPKDIQLIIVPGVGFDIKGNRIGYGFGYYDSLLSETRQEIPFIGLAFDFQIQDEIPCEDHDKYIDKIITEKRIIECKNEN